jgi:outer membrane receptor protein involved in Fe transport
MHYSSIDAFTGIYNSNPATTVPFQPTRVRNNFNYTNNTRDYILANPSAKFKVNLLSAYVQDEFQVADNLKLTGGIRLDYAGVPNKQPLSDKTANAAVDPAYGTTLYLYQTKRN